MRTFLLIILLFIITGCSYPHPNMLPYTKEDGAQIYDKPVFTDTLMAMPIYYITYENQDYPRCHKKGFCVLLPKLYKKDYEKPNRGWSLMSSSDGFGVTAEFVDGWIDYGINIFSSVGKYGKDEKSLDKGDDTYLKNIRIIKFQDGKSTNLNLHIEHHGKENYPCEVGESINELRGYREKFYNCYKFNPKHTKYKKVGITFIYTKSPTLPKELEPLAKEYTYEDLLKRGQRVLDSLYIKDGWDE